MTRSDWIGIIGGIIGLIGIITGYMFYERSIAEKEPIFFVHPERISLINAESLKDSKIRITRTDGTPIDSNVTALRFFFWNKGKTPIKASDVYQNDPLTFSFEKNTEILDVKILKMSRPKIVKADLKIVPDAPAHSLGLTFDTLEENDGLSVQIIYAGSTLAKFRLSGTILGVKDINNYSINNDFKFNKYGLIFMWLFTIPLMIYVCTSIYNRHRLSNSEIIEKNRTIKFLEISIVFAIVCLITFLSIITFRFYYTGTLGSISSIIEYNVPESFR
jgi:hypothetical protein